MLAISIFLAVVGFTLGLSFYMGRQAKDASGYFAAHGQIPWFVNGVAFAGDYLSAASFLGICGMIAFYGYDGFLYSIGYLAGWIVALFVIAEPLKQMGKFTFGDALNARFQSKSIQIVAGISTLAVSIFYLIPQMVGAGALVKPLLGLPNWAGVCLVGTTVILIVVTAGMVSTTWVQFFKGSLLIVFSFILTIAILFRGLDEKEGGIDGHKFSMIELGELDPSLDDIARRHVINQRLSELGYQRLQDSVTENWEADGFWRILPTGASHSMIYRLCRLAGRSRLMECQSMQDTAQGKQYNYHLGSGRELHPIGFIGQLNQDQNATVGNRNGIDDTKQPASTGPIGPWRFLQVLSNSEVVLWSRKKLTNATGETIEVFYPKPTPGSQIVRPGEHPTFAGIRQDEFWPKLNFLSLMLALFCGTASLPHILIRYYTVKDGAAARKSTIVGIATIGTFYILTLYMGLGAMTSGALDPTNDNMSAPLLARSISELLFAIISAVAFTTVLGTVSGLILASAGAVSHDLLKSFTSRPMSGNAQVRVAKIASIAVGILAIVLGIAFEQMNVSYLVGWAFSVAASANLPALVMLLFWKRTTSAGIVAAVLVGMSSSLAWILLSSETFEKVYATTRPDWIASIIPFSQPGIVTIPLSFLTLVAVSLFTRPNENRLVDFNSMRRRV